MLSGVRHPSTLGVRAGDGGVLNIRRECFNLTLVAIPLGFLNIGRRDVFKPGPSSLSIDQDDSFKTNRPHLFVCWHARAIFK